MRTEHVLELAGPVRVGVLVEDALPRARANLPSRRRVEILQRRDHLDGREEDLLNPPLTVWKPVDERGEIAPEMRLGRHRVMRVRIKRVVDRDTSARPQ